MQIYHVYQLYITVGQIIPKIQRLKMTNIYFTAFCGSTEGNLVPSYSSGRERRQREYPIKSCHFLKIDFGFYSNIRFTAQSSRRPTLAYHYHPKSIIYIKIHSWYCTFHGFGQIYNDMCLPLQYRTEQSHCPKTSSILHLPP